MERHFCESICFIRCEKYYKIDFVILLKPVSRFPISKSVRNWHLLMRRTPPVKVLVHFPLENFFLIKLNFRALCQKKCLKGDLHNSSCFLVSNIAYTFEDAEKYCKTEGMQLASLHS